MGSTKRKNREITVITARSGKRTEFGTLFHKTFNVQSTNAETPPTDVDEGFPRNLIVGDKSEFSIRAASSNQEKKGRLWYLLRRCQCHDASVAGSSVK